MTVGVGGRFRVRVLGYTVQGEVGHERGSFLDARREVHRRKVFERPSGEALFVRLVLPVGDALEFEAGAVVAGLAADCTSPSAVVPGHADGKMSQGKSVHKRESGARLVIDDGGEKRSHHATRADGKQYFRRPP